MTMNVRIGSIAVAATIVVLGGVACGGDDQPTGTEPIPTVADTLAMADSTGILGGSGLTLRRVRFAYTYRDRLLHAAVKIDADSDSFPPAVSLVRAAIVSRTGSSRTINLRNTAVDGGHLLALDDVFGWSAEPPLGLAAWLADGSGHQLILAQDSVWVDGYGLRASDDVSLSPGR
ncbi:MAG: hypothetical protein KC729_02045 [Candidatus Eisenbacteria bacterium]|uniref:Uncharacterized protein n=1 Tax=Eiseniibacteriota bacterium TaxID=2212470 RepID=A0A956RMV1_UNCEI|nr:hypothetical protein [Candidatus Eisenbacteria bacterium]